MSRLFNPILRKPTQRTNGPLVRGGGGPQRGQGMVEFALVLPLLLFLFFGIMELGRFLIIYTSVHAASREGARYGSAAGLNDSGIPYFLDEDGIIAAARRIATLVGADVDSIAYDSGPGTMDLDPVPTTGVEVSLGDRIKVTVVAQFNPILGLTPLQPFEITSTTSRTIVKAVAIGPSGNAGGGATNFPPQVEITSPTQPPNARYEIFEGDPLALTATAQDPEQGDITASIVWSLGGSSYPCSGGSCNMPGLGPGNHSILAEVTDSEGNDAADSFELFVNPRPTITITSPSNNEHLYPSSANHIRTITFSGYAEEEIFNGVGDGDLSANIQWFDNGVPFGTGASFDVTNMSVGLHTIRADIADSDGQTASATITIVIDALTPPTLVINSPPNNARFSLDDNIPFSGFADDAQDGLLSGSITWTSSVDGPIGVGASFTTDSLTDNGWHTITASVIDIDLMTATASINVFVRQNQPPDVTITSPNNGNAYTAFQGASITFSATANDELDGIISNQIRWTSDTGVINRTGASFTRSDLPIGDHVVTARATDRHGLWAEDFIRITIVNAPPVVTIDAPANNAILRANTNFNLRGTATDTGDGLISHLIQWTHSGTTLGTGASITTTLGAGTHNITASVTDSGLLSATASIQVRVYQTICPTSQSTIWGSGRSSLTWRLTIPAQTPLSSIMNSLGLMMIGTPATVSSITVDGVTVFSASPAAGSPINVPGPLWTGNYPTTPYTLPVVFNFATRPNNNQGVFNLLATFAGCPNPVSASATP